MPEDITLFVSPENRNLPSLNVTSISAITIEPTVYESCTPNYLTFVKTTAVAYGQKIDRSLRVLVVCNTSRFYKLQAIGSTHNRQGISENMDYEFIWAWDVYGFVLFFHTLFEPRSSGTVPVLLARREFCPALYHPIKGAAGIPLVP